MVEEGEEGWRGRRVQLPVPRWGRLLCWGLDTARGAWAGSGGPRRRFGKLNPGLLPLLDPLPGPVLRGDWESVLPARGTLDQVSRG